MKKIIINGRIVSLFLLLSIASCKKLVDVNPPITSTTGDNIYNSDATAISVLTGIYSKISSQSNFSNAGLPSTSLLCGLSSDEFTLFSGITSPSMIAYYRNSLNTVNIASGNQFWNTIYPVVFTCNSAIEGLSVSETLTPAVKQQLIGEAKFMRAFCYFYLVNLYGDLPLVLSTNYSTTSIQPRVDKSLIYLQIINDLNDAKVNLSSNYQDATLIKTTTERIRPNKWAALALLARAYLYTGNWTGADSASSAVIGNSLYSLSPITGTNSVFNKNSSEAIWQLQPVTVGWNTDDARAFNLATAPAGLSNSKPVYISSSLLASFETGDQRRINGNWVSSYTASGNTYYYPNKYKIATQNTAVTTPASLTEYLMVLRLGEQYLIRAEARANQANISGATSDLNAIRTRAGLPNTTATTQTSLLSAINNERRVELFSEWGHRWFDLKRTNTINAVMTTATPLKGGGSWNTIQQLFPIPNSEINANPFLVQNAGY